ncbi:hypothetical protein RRG08_024812 [Elysia crispata]|uniref:Uncharacterized protein n=1 Tax=Elysia crispata TaxID=231223 RepID=A0AAE1D086_9GAST|nr:hypothetical protein RRG08_024812 [Elysia crispata]
MIHGFGYPLSNRIPGRARRALVRVATRCGVCRALSAGPVDTVQPFDTGGNFTAGLQKLLLIHCSGMFISQLTDWKHVKPLRARTVGVHRGVVAKIPFGAVQPTLRLFYPTFSFPASRFDAHAIGESMLPLSFSMSGESMVDMQNTERDKDNRRQKNSFYLRGTSLPYTVTVFINLLWRTVGDRRLVSPERDESVIHRDRFINLL